MFDYFSRKRVELFELEKIGFEAKVAAQKINTVIIQAEVVQT